MNKLYNLSFIAQPEIMHIKCIKKFVLNSFLKKEIRRRKKILILNYLHKFT